MSLSVIVSTYNQPEWLGKVLHGYMEQTFRDFEIVVADDGSDDRTREVIENFRQVAGFPIRHVWHPDEGFQKSRILNRATEAAAGDYLIFTDGDCIPRRDFVAAHVNHAAPNTFLSGGYCKLPMDLSRRLTSADIRTGAAFDVGFLRRHGLRGFSQTLKLGVPDRLRPAMDRITPRKATWNGCNASTWKADILAVNGHNEEMQYGGQDREMGERLRNRGLTGKQIQHRAILLHLDHKRGYKTPETLKKNMAIRDEVVASGSTWCANGIQKMPQP
jgi:glycosyltransferase involved in cell wall biosynthesis